MLANVELALTISGVSRGERRQRAKQALEEVGLGNQLHKRPSQMSGGQMQRVAIARALVNDPDILLADEPTGALDSRSAGQILDIFADVNRSGQTILMVTHSVQAACRAGRVLFIKDGQVYHQIYRGAMTDDELYQAISRTLTELATSRERSVAVHG